MVHASHRACAMSDAGDELLREIMGIMLFLWEVGCISDDYPRLC